MNKMANNHHYLSASECLNLLSDQQKQELFENRDDLECEPDETVVKRGILVDNYFLPTSLTQSPLIIIFWS